MTDTSKPDWADIMADKICSAQFPEPFWPTHRALILEALRKAEEQGYKRGFAAGMGVSYGGKD